MDRTAEFLSCVSAVQSSAHLAVATTQVRRNCLKLNICACVVVFSCVLSLLADHDSHLTQQQALPRPPSSATAAKFSEAVSELSSDLHTTWVQLERMTKREQNLSSLYAPMVLLFGPVLSASCSKSEHS